MQLVSRYRARKTVFGITLVSLLMCDIAASVAHLIAHLRAVFGRQAISITISVGETSLGTYDKQSANTGIVARLTGRGVVDLERVSKEANLSIVADYQCSRSIRRGSVSHLVSSLVSQERFNILRGWDHLH